MSSIVIPQGKQPIANICKYEPILELDAYIFVLSAYSARQ